ncbi:MAG: transglycosylase SLT domain-containing protein [Deltaproteobacteria bacterium]|nr:transglycosylase SLT domain-containing protein [Deltaproteobacteria bacterium]
MLKILLLVTLVIVPQSAAAVINPFPVFPAIRSNVRFWEKVYSQYSSEHGLIHDSNNLAIIYEVIALRDCKIPANSRLNRRKIKAAEKKYRRILRHLANGHPAVSALEKRIITMFGGHPDPQILRRASHNVRFQLCLKDRFRQGIINSGRYLAEIKQIFRQNHLPTDLAYLPHVESSFNYEAYSKFGAAGIWQFIRSTGRRFLTISYTVDERRDPIKATKAAARYLKENYRKLRSWPLALTAYNHGAGSICRAQKKFGTYDEIIENYQNCRFGFASKNFYPEFLAAREIAKHYRKYFPGLHMKHAISTDSISLSGYADAVDLATFFGINAARLRVLNPGLRPPVFNGQKYIPKHYRLRLPRGTINKSTVIPANLYKKAQKRSRFYRVERGDTAGKIAIMQRVKLRDLLDFNQLGHRAVIYVGQNLRIPVPNEQLLASLSGKTGRRRIYPRKRKKLESKRANKMPAKKPVRLADSPGTTVEIPTMLPSHTTNWHPREIPLGASHKVWQEQPAIEPPPANMMSVNPEVLIGNFQLEKVFTDRHGKRFGVLRVEESETLGHYADWLNIPTQRIRDLNHLPFHRRIKTHQKIKIPLGKTSRESFAEQRYEFHKQIAEDFFAAFKVTGIKTYNVKSGDNIWTISRNELDLPLWLIKQYNPGTNFENLHPRQKLLFPVVVKAH